MIIKSTQEFLNWYLGLNLATDGVEGPMTRDAKTKAIIKLKREFTALNYKWFSSWHIVGFRMTDKFTNQLVDYLIFVSDYNIYVQKASTVAGQYYVSNPLTVGGVTGTAILKPGQYIDSWKFVTSANWKTLWLGEPYFQQVKNVDIYRDNNRDNNADTNTKLYNGLYGINIHHAGSNNIVYNWSASCQVASDITWKEGVELCNFVNNRLYTYTLIKK